MNSFCPWRYIPSAFRQAHHAPILSLCEVRHITKVGPSVPCRCVPVPSYFTPPAKWRVIFCLTVALDRRAGDRYVARDHRGGDLDCLLTGSQFQRQHLMNNLQETLRPIYLTSRPMENTRRCNRPGLNEPCSKCPGIVQTTLALPPMVPCGRVSFAAR
jgi:hypothetical protein